MKYITLVIEDDERIKIYTDTRISQGDVIKHLENARFIMKDQPMKANLYTNTRNNRGK